MKSPPERILHPALGAAGPGEVPVAPAVVPLAAARLGDRQRLAVVLQGAALLAHLEHAGWCLQDGWSGAGIGAGDGLLWVPGARPGRPPQLLQESLRELLSQLFGGPEIAGRGQARRSARTLLDSWHQSLAPVTPERALEAIFAAAPFLWEPAFGDARATLVAELRWAHRGELWIGGPRAFRRRLLARASSRGEAVALLAGAAAHRLWQPRQDPLELAAAGRWREALEQISGSSAGAATPAEERLALARWLFAEGRFEDALEALGRLRSGDALVLRGWCQLYLGRMPAVTKTLTRLAAVGRAPAEILDAAELGVRACANGGDGRGVDRWLERAAKAAAGDPELEPRALLLEAFAAWDLERPERMEPLLEACRVLASDPRRGWRWHQAKALAAEARGEAAAMAEPLHRALGGYRRCLTRFEAGGLWNDLGVARGRAGDLAGAERAFLHTQRLLDGCQGPRRTTLALYNVAEIRLRQGRLHGVLDILERTTEENRLAGNLRGRVQDAELWARYEMVQGRFDAADSHLRRALAELDRKGTDWHRAELELLRCRALGLAGRAEEAGAAFERSSPEALTELEAEERPALWAHAGRREEALAAAAETPWDALWQAALAGRVVTLPEWRPVEDLIPFRAARLVLDLERAAPGVVPARLRRSAAGVLRRLGAGEMADLLERRDAGPWQAMTQYQRRAAAEPPGEEQLAELLIAAGYGEARLEWQPEDPGAPPRILQAGVGGAEERRLRLQGGELVLSAAAIDPVLEALMAVAGRDFRPPRRERESAGRGGIVGESPELLAALGRLERLALGSMPVLVYGESGTGKELAARRVHQLSPRAGAAFVAVNCAALAEHLVLSDLFGHVRGAFTGADRDRAGVFESARGGTVFLDEIGDLPLPAQGMLLRVLQEGEVRRLGESLPRKVDVRVVAATHRDLERRVRDGEFRQDLFFRLRVALVTLPPLRDRGQDVVLLAQHFLARLESEPGRGGSRLSPAARARLLGHPWPGNVRELLNVLQVAVALAEGGVVEPQHLDLPEAGPAPVTDYHQTLEAFRRRLVDDALEAAGGNQAEAARRLGLSRQALSYLVRQLRRG